jgi:hypothetical protein
MSIQNLQEQLDPDLLPLIDQIPFKGRFAMLTDQADGLDPKIFAENFGYTSVDEMITELVGAPTMREAVDTETDARMLELFGDLNSKEAKANALSKALHGVNRERVLLTEFHILNKKVGDKQALSRAAKAVAKETIAKLEIRNIKPNEYHAAERRANRNAEAALARGNIDEAANHKRAAILNFHFAREATEALDTVDKSLKKFNQIDSKGARKKITAEYSLSIDEILNKYDLRKSVTEKAINERGKLRDWLASEEKKGNTPQIPAEVLERSQPIPYKTMQFSEFVAMRDAVDSLEHTGRMKASLIAGQERREFDAVVSDLVAENEKHNNGKAAERRGGRISTGLPGDKKGKLFRGLWAEHRKMANLFREMDGFEENGPWWNAWVRPMNERADWEAVRVAKENESLGKLFSAYSNTEFTDQVPLLGEAVSDKILPDTRLYKKRSFKNVPRGRDDLRPATVAKAEIIMIALNWGNADNRLRVKDGFGWEDSHVEELLDTLDGRDWKFIQDTWDYIDSFWGEIKAKEERVFGVAPDKVLALPITNKYGSFRGGYFPIKFSRDLNAKSFQQGQGDLAKELKAGAYGHATTARGHTKARLDAAGDKPIHLSFDVIFEHITAVVHDLAWHENLRDTSKLLNDGRVQATIVNNQGIETFNAIQDTVQDVAVGDMQGMSSIEQVYNYLRSGVSISAMGWNFGTALLQPLGMTQGFVRVGPKWVMKGLSQWLVGGTRMENVIEEMYAESSFMRMRAKTMNREINEIQNKVGTAGFTGKAALQMRQSFFSMIVKAQLIADTPIWLGAKEKALAGNFSVPEAIAQADQAVIDSQGSGHIKDLAGAQRGSPLKKLFTNFMSYFQTTFNLTVDSFTRTKFNSLSDILQLGSDLFFLYSMPIILQHFVREAWIKGSCDYGADIECSIEKIGADHVSYAMGGIIGIRELNSIVSGFYGYQGPAGARIFSDAGRFAQQVGQGELDEKFALATLRLSGGALHFPSGQVEKLLRGYMDIQDGKTGNILAPLFGRDRSND